MSRPTPARLADLKRTGAWPFLTWCFARRAPATGSRPAARQAPRRPLRGVDSRHPDDVARIVEVAERFGWSANWTRDVSRGGLSLLCLTARQDAR